MPTANEDYDIVIESPDATRTGFNIVREKDKPVFTFDYLPSLSPRQDSGATNYGQVPPDQEVTMVIRDGVDGSGHTTTSDNEIRSIAWADGVDTRAKNEVSLGSALSETPTNLYILPDGDFENGSIDVNWRTLDSSFNDTVGGGPPVSAVTGNARNGTYAAQIITAGSARTYVYKLSSKWGAGHFLTGKITFGVWAKRTSGTGTVDLVVWGDNSGATVGGTVNTSSYTYYSVSHTFNSSDTEMFVGFREVASDGSGTGTYIHFDDAHVFGGGIANDGVVKFVRQGSVMYTVTKGGIWSSTGDFVYCPGGEITDAVEYQGDIFVAHAGALAFSYSSDMVTWTASTIASIGKNATYFGKVRSILFKEYLGIGYSATSPKTAWTSVGNVGDTGTVATSIIPYNDTPFIGREDGLFQYDRTDDLYHDITPEFQYALDTKNFKVGVAHQGWLYVSTANGLFRYDGTSFQSLRTLLFPSGLDEFGGAIKAMATDSEYVYFLQEDNLAETSASKSAWLIAMHEDLTQGSGVLAVIPYTLGKLAVGVAGAAMVSNGVIHIGGALQDIKIGSAGNLRPHWFQYTLPTRSLVPARDTAPALGTSGDIVFPAWDAGFPDVTKVFTKFTIKGLNMSANKTIAVKFSLDADINTAVSSFVLLGTATSNGDTTFDFSGETLANRSGKTISIAYTLATNDATDSPFALVGVLKALLRTTKLKRFSITLRSQGALGAENDYGQSGLATLLRDTYIDTAWPLKLEEDFANTGTPVSHNVKLENVRERVLVDEDGAETVYECEFWEVNI